MKSRNFAISKNKLYEFFGYLADNYVIAVAEKYEPSVIKRELSNKKIYLYDNGLFSANFMLLEDEKGKLLENLVFAQLYRRSQKVMFYKNSFECDFLVSDEQGLLPIQVTYKLDEENREREFGGILKTMDRFKLKRGLIITRDETATEIIADKKISIVSVVKWLLSE